MDYRTDVDAAQAGGSDGCVNFADPDNKGLTSCLNSFGIPAVYDKVKAKVSLADFFIIAAEVAAARASNSYKATDPWADGTLAAKFRDGFKFGRATVTDCPWNTGRMPNPEHSCLGDDAAGEKNSLKHVFIDHVYKGRADAWAMVAAISGAHTVGRANMGNSGYDGHWARASMTGKFDNDYYRSIIIDGWGPEEVEDPPGSDKKTGKWQWRITNRKFRADPAHPVMMLNSDMCMAYS